MIDTCKQLRQDLFQREKKLVPKNAYFLLFITFICCINRADASHEKLIKYSGGSTGEKIVIIQWFADVLLHQVIILAKPGVVQLRGYFQRFVNLKFNLKFHGMS